MSWKGTSTLEIVCSGRWFCCVCFLTVILLPPQDFLKIQLWSVLMFFKSMLTVTRLKYLWMCRIHKEIELLKIQLLANKWQKKFGTRIISSFLDLLESHEPLWGADLCLYRMSLAVTQYWALTGDPWTAVINKYWMCIEILYILMIFHSVKWI